MIQTGMESRVKIQDIVSNQLPEFILDESPKALDFLKQYYISQEYQGGPVDLTDNLDQYLKVDNLKPEVIVDSTTLSNSITSTDTVIEVSSTKGFPNQYGLFKIDDEIVTYTGITTNSFTGCIRGFSGISEFDQDSINRNLVFSTSDAASHQSNASVQNLSSLFLKEFYRKLKSTFTPGLENISFVDEIDAGNFIKRAKDFYASKGTDEAIKILFKVIFGESPSIINLEDYLIKPSSANYVRREIVIADVISGEPSNIVGETLIKTSDTSTSASISAVEGFTRKGKTFYKIELYIGNDGRSSVEGNFVITPNTKLIESVTVGDSILTVDSTVSFPETGTLISGDNTISYTGKSINQFFGCTGITSDIASTSNVRSNDTYFSYEGGDTTKKVELLILGVISKFQEETEGFKTSEGDIITIKNLGDKIKNTKSNWKEIFTNSFIYNTSARYQITDNSTVKLGSTIDRSSLKKGDEIEVLERGTEVVVATNDTVFIQGIDTAQNTLTLLNGPILDPNKKYDVRRKLNKAKFAASGLPDTLNLYVETDEYGYVASNSLPSKIRTDEEPVNDYRLDINTSIKSVGITSIIEDGNTGIYTAFQVSSGTVPFLTGDKVYYSPLDEPLVGLDTGTYFVEKTSNIEFRLYGAQSLIYSDSYITFQKPDSGIGTHTFTLNSQVDSELGVQKLLRKFPLEKNIRNGSGELTVPGSTGMLINGVEINNYKSNDVIYYGPIESVDILSGGDNYDVINPPLIDVSTGLTTAYIQPVISGKFEKVYVDTQDYNIDKIVSIDISGGNGKGAVIDPVIVFRPREVLFNADEFSDGGGVNPSTNQIVFLTNHNFVNGQQVVYNSLGNNPISIGTAGNNFDLPDNSSYFVEVTNNTTIRLYNNLSDQQSGTNPVGIYTGSTGSHRFSTLDSVKQIDSIKVVDPGEGYTNRKLIVESTGIGTANNIINFKNHGFKSGELVEYAGSQDSSLQLKVGGIAGKFFNGDWRSVISTGNIGTIPLTTANDSSNVTGSAGMPDASYRFGVKVWPYIDFGPSLGEYYGWIGIGYFIPPVSGTYRFRTRSDDGSGVWIGDLALEGATRTTANALVDNGMGFGQAATNATGDIFLSAGVIYPIRIVHEELIGGDEMDFKWRVQGGSGSEPGLDGVFTTDLTKYFYYSTTSSGTVTGNFGGALPVVGISTTNLYYVLKNDDDSFRLCDAGVGGTSTSNYERGDYEKITGSGLGKQIFKYPDISVSIQYTTAGIGSTTQSTESLVVTPVVKGEIVDGYVYEAGTGYGSTILNYENKPTITIQNGKLAQLTPVVVGGRITNVSVSYQGTQYYSVPDLVVSGDGTGAELRAIVTNGRISEVKVLNTGVGYAQSTTSISIIASGKGAIIDPQIRKLTLNDNFVRFTTGEVLLKGKDKLQYTVSKYFEDLRTSFLEDETLRSGIIGWAYDGNPIYGPYGHPNPSILSGVKTLESGYTLDSSNVTDRPSGFDDGFFVEDYKFDDSGDLDEYNGRYEKNEDFPNGVYAYHATIDEFPYFIGNKYRSGLISDSDLNQSFDFNGSNLHRNTLPYKVSELEANYDFVNETSDVLDQRIEVISVTSNSIDSLEIQNAGNNYKVGDKLIFDETNASGSGLNAIVDSVKGKSIANINTNSISYLNSIFTWDSSEKVKITILPKHDLSNLDYVTITGFSTNLSTLNGTHRISVPSYENGRCLSTITSSGITTEIYVAPIPEGISIGSSIGIGTETLNVLGIFRNQNILRIERGVAGASHTVGTAVSFLPDSFTISKSLDKFESTVNDKVFFNPRESVGVSTINGVGYSTSFIFGDISVTRSIPSKGLYINNHPFVTNQPVVYTGAGTTLTVSTDGLSASEVYITSFSNLFAINKNPNLIGLKTAIDGQELFFHSNGDDNDLYTLESNYTQILGDVQKNEVTVSVSTAHELQSGDTVSLNVQPNLSVGIGTSTAVRVLYKNSIDNIVVNPIGFNSTGVNTTTNEFTISNHELETGDKVLYEDSGYGEYFVYRINENKINLCETEFDAKQNPPTIVSFASTGGSSQSISLINPKLNPIKNNNLVFDLSDSSLSGYELKIYTDSEFNNEFVSTGSTTSFTVSGVGTVGVSSTASLTLDYSSNIPDFLYYTLEKEGTLVTSDEDVKNYSQIRYQESIYNDVYKVTAIGTTTFNVNIPTKPERSSYISTECDTLEYSTTSAFASGPVSSLKVLSFGSGYKELPSSNSTNSTDGTDLIVNAKSNTIGSLKEYKVLNNKFTYSSDRTLRPKANVSPTLVLKDFNTIDQLLVVDGGEGYAVAPKLTIVNPVTRNVIDSGLLKANLTSSAISSVDINVAPSGLPDENVEIFATDNTNGIAITKVQSSSLTEFTCTLSTPGIGTTAGSGFSVQPFNIGDDVFVEGIQKFGTDGTGFNSADYGYKFFKVSTYTPNGDGVNDTVTINVTGLTTNTGIAKTVQDFSGVIINKNDYPVFEITQKLSKFNIGESLSSNGIIRDLKVAANNENNLTVSGSYDLSVGETIKGVESGAVATIQTLDPNEGSFDISYSNVKEIGWDTQTGRLSEDYQVIPDNDYYQNLSYSIKSSVTYRDQQSPVENLVHTSGLKNFADTGITSSTSAGLDKTNDGFVVVYDIIDEKRVDTINNFDNVVDQDVVDSTSKFLNLENKRLANSTTLKNLNVLTVDDLSDLFSNSEAENTEFLSIAEVDDNTYHNYLFRVTNIDGSEIQLTDLTILSDGLETVIVENESLQNTDLPFGSFDLVESEFDETFLRFIPNDPFNKDYDVKLIKQTFNTTNSYTGTQPVGFVSLTGSVDVETGSVGLGTTTIISLNSSDFESLYVNAQVIDTITNDMNYVRLYVVHDGTDTYLSEYYIDNTLSASTGSQIGTFYSNLNGGVLSITHENTSTNTLKIRSNVVGLGTTTSGAGAYRFKSNDQLDGQERSVIYQSNFQSMVGIASTTIQTLDKTLFDASKSVVQISIGSSKALHQVMMIFDGSDVYTQQLPLLSVDTITSPFDTLSGIGTFGGEVSGSNIILKFYPDNQSLETKIEVFSKSFYTLVDSVNDYNDLEYGAVTESIDEKFYNAVNGDRINRTAFPLLNDTTPIFSKEFNPNSVALAATTGLFTIPNHFFQTGEELIYTPNSTIVGVGTSAMMTSATDVLPSTVYAIKVTEDTFKVAITTTAAQSGIGTIFTSLGEGNAHRFTMKERNSKCIITIDKLVQYPVAFAGISHSLSGNLGISTTFVTLSGISSINPQDILLVDNEYMGVTNIGYGTTIDGPITNSGSIKLVEVERGFVGSSASTHTNSTTVDVYRGAFNIIDNEIHFAEAPRGNPQIDKTRSNLDYETSSFSGRVFFKSNYDSNKVYDDLSEEFTGIGRTFNLTVGGANATGIGTDGGNGLIFINNIYQSPKTDNNPTRFNYEISEGVGITTVEFSGITSFNDPNQYVVSAYDVNQNETPRGGVIVSYGSTPGLGFAPLVGASVTAVVGAGGSIVSVGLGTTDNLGSGYNGLVSIGVSVFEEGHSGNVAVVEATANPGAGGTLSFNVVDGGTGYTNPQIYVSDPSYENLPVTGVYREGIGNTTTTGVGLLMDVIVGGASTSVGIGSTYFEVREFQFSRPGYGFMRGDVFKPVGLVTDSTLGSPLQDFEITVVDTYSDNFAAWEFGELDYIDSIKNLQNGLRVRFPLNYNGELLSFEPESNSPIEDNINNVLVIFINGILQEPVTNYIFEGGTSFVFTKAPLEEDEVEIYFYKGVESTDTDTVIVRPTIKTGDVVQVISNNIIPNTLTQEERTVYNLSFSDKFETNRYSGEGIDEQNYKPLSWTKQKSDRKINGEFVSKSRDVLEALVFPTAKIIKDVSTTDTDIFVDNVELFEYEDNRNIEEAPSVPYPDGSKPCDVLIVNGISTVGYSTGLVEKITGFNNIQGFSGIVTGITTSTGTGSNPLAIQFTVIDQSTTGFVGIETGNPIYIYDTTVGNGVASIDNSDSETVGIGTIFVDNVYYISDFSYTSPTGNTHVGILTCNILSTTNTTGINTSGDILNPVGKYSWGKLSGGTRSSNPISIGVTGNTVSGLSTYPTIQRRGGVNIRATGALPKIET